MADGELYLMFMFVVVAISFCNWIATCTFMLHDLILAMVQQVLLGMSFGLSKLKLFLDDIGDCKGERF